LLLIRKVGVEVLVMTERRKLIERVVAAVILLLRSAILRVVRLMRGREIDGLDTALRFVVEVVAIVVREAVFRRKLARNLMNAGARSGHRRRLAVVLRGRLLLFRRANSRGMTTRRSRRSRGLHRTNFRPFGPT